MTRRSWALLILVAAVWGSSYLFIALALEDVGPFVLVCARLGGAALVLLPVLVRHRSALAGRWPYVFATALPQLAAPFVLISAGEQRVSSGLAGILVAAMPLWLVVLAPALRLPRPGLVSVLGLLAGLLGVGVLMGGVGTGTDVDIVGALMVIAAAACYAIGAAFVRKFLAGIDALVVTAATMAAATILTAPFAAFQLPDHMPGLTTIGALLALALVCTAGAFAAFNRMIADVGPQRAGLVAYIAPVFAVTYGAVLLSEPVGVGTFLGLTLILGGSWVSSRYGPKPAPARPAAHAVGEPVASGHSSSRLKEAEGGRL